MTPANGQADAPAAADDLLCASVDTLATADSRTSTTTIVPLESLQEWATRLWKRINRNNDDYVTMDELNCDEFQRALRSIIAPGMASLTTSVPYARSEIHVMQTLGFCFRKADINGDGRLSFKEFKSLLRVLSNEQEAKDKANLIFALFDLDGTNTIDRDEFREVFRYFKGRHPTADELTAEWRKLDPNDLGEATRASYTRWLETSADPAFRQAAPALPEGDRRDTRSSELVARTSSSIRRLPDAPRQLLAERRRKHREQLRPDWNERFNNKDVSAQNEASVKNERAYFSRPQSLPELTRYYERHPRRLESNRRRLQLAANDKPCERRRCIELSTETHALPKLLPGRYEPGGTMRKHGLRGPVIGWNDHWVPPGELRMAASALNAKGLRPGVRPRPGSMTLRCAGQPPAWAVLGKDWEEEEEEAEQLVDVSEWQMLS